MAFTDAPRNLAIFAEVVVNQGGNSARANELMAEVITDFELLELQGKEIIGTKLWEDTIRPLV